MNERQLNADRDLFISSNRVARCNSTAQTVAQRVATMLRTFVGEAYVNRSYGIDWFGDVLGSDAVSLNIVSSILRDKIGATPGVADVVSLDVKTEGRVLSGSFVIKTVTGETEFGEF